MLQVALMTSIAGLAIASSATAAVITFTNQAQWNSVTSSFGALSFTETFAGLDFLASPQLAQLAR